MSTKEYLIALALSTGTIFATFAFWYLLIPAEPRLDVQAITILCAFLILLCVTNIIAYTITWMTKN